MSKCSKLQPFVFRFKFRGDEKINKENKQRYIAYSLCSGRRNTNLLLFKTLVVTLLTKYHSR